MTQEELEELLDSIESRCKEILNTNVTYGDSEESARKLQGKQDLAEELAVCILDARHASFSRRYRRE